jgi:hypothetical protein
MLIGTTILERNQKKLCMFNFEKMTLEIPDRVTNSMTVEKENAGLYKELLMLLQ